MLTWAVMPYKRQQTLFPHSPDSCETKGVGKDPIFPSLKGKSGSGKSVLSSQFKKIMAAAKIQGRKLRETKGEGREQSSLSFHSLRHSFVSALANAGVAAEVRQKLAGHSDSKSHARYSHHEVETMRAAVDLLPGLSSGSNQ